MSRKRDWYSSNAVLRFSWNHIHFILENLKKLSLIFKKGLQFLNALSFCRQYVVMLPPGQARQVRWSIIIFNPIKVVDNPAIRQVLAMSFFPYKNMLENHPRISLSLTCSRMFRFINKNIAFVFTGKAFTEWVVNSFYPVVCRPEFAIIPPVFNGAMFASHCFISRDIPIFCKVNRLIAIKAISLFPRSSVSTVAFHTSLCCIGTSPTAVNTFISMIGFPLLAFFFSPHVFILTQGSLDSKRMVETHEI